MDIIKTSQKLKIIWKSKISKSITKANDSNNFKKDYISYRTIFPLDLYKYLNLKNNTLFIYKTENQKLIITSKKPILSKSSCKITLKQNNSNKKHPNNSGKRMSLKKSFFNKTNLNKSTYILFILEFNINNKDDNSEEICYLEIK